MAGNWGGKSNVETIDYGKEYTPKRTVKVIKKDGSTEEFNVQKVINAVGKSAYRALTKFTEEEKRKIYLITDLGTEVLNLEMKRIARLYKNMKEVR